MDQKEFYRNSCFESKSNISPAVLADAFKKKNI